MQAARYADAVRDYGAAYDLSHDPALLYKLGRAHELAGACELALGYYQRYLREGQPSEEFAELTRQRIAACGGTAPERPAGSAASAAGATGTVPAGGAARTPRAPAAPTGGASPAAAAAPAEAAPAAAPVVLVPSNPHKVAWLMSGSALALITLGGVLAYAATSSENDIRDLYAGFAGRTPAFDAQTDQRYRELIDNGRRFQHLSWAAFGLAGAAAAGAAVLFVVGERDEPARPARVTPVITPKSAGVAIGF